MEVTIHVNGYMHVCGTYAIRSFQLYFFLLKDLLTLETRGGYVFTKSTEATHTDDMAEKGLCGFICLVGPLILRKQGAKSIISHAGHNLLSIFNDRCVSERRV